MVEIFVISSALFKLWQTEEKKISVELYIVYILIKLSGLTSEFWHYNYLWIETMHHFKQHKKNII